MAMSVEELDATVRTFYEGRGETVRKPNNAYFSGTVVINHAFHSKNPPNKL